MMHAIIPHPRSVFLVVVVVDGLGRHQSVVIGASRVLSIVSHACSCGVPLHTIALLCVESMLLPNLLLFNLILRLFKEHPSILLRDNNRPEPI